jgi:UDP-glucose 4-epimerase
MRVVVTGGAGFIGGQTVLKLLDQGHSVFAIDSSKESNSLNDCGAKWLTGDFAGEVALHTIRQFKPDAVIHCAGTSLVGPSLSDPSLYYDNNFIKTKQLCDALLQLESKPRVIFSSSAATYGNPIITPCQEIDPCEPISPYGQSKLMTEWMLSSYQHAYGLDFVSFRYFNVCGADSQGRHGQRTDATHIIARVLESIKYNKTFTLNGDNFETPDGTCVRDYIHVEDLTDAHVLALNTVVPSGVYNLGTNQGFSNREIIAMAEKVTGKSVALVVGPARPGDPAMLTADANRFVTVTNWCPKHDLELMVSHAWDWYLKS